MGRYVLRLSAGGGPIEPGSSGTASATLNFTIPFDRQSYIWSRLRPSVLPSARWAHAMASHNTATATQLVMFGGRTAASGADVLLGDTWLFNGTAWSAYTGVGPSARVDHTMSIGPGNTIVLFGSRGPLGALPQPGNDTWVWDGTMWISQQPTVSPPGRGRAAMAYVPGFTQVNTGVSGTTAIVVPTATYLFGGYIVGGVPSNEMWRWDGTTWSAVEYAAGSLVPAARWGAGMAYDEHRKVLVMHGGTGATGFNETWEFEPAQRVWTARGAAGMPSGLLTPMMYWDFDRQAVVMMGDANGVSTQTWTYDGTAWQPTSGCAPKNSGWSAMALDASSNPVVFGGTSALAAGVGVTGENAMYRLQRGPCVLCAPSSVTFTPGTIALIPDIGCGEQVRNVAWWKRTEGGDVPIVPDGIHIAVVNGGLRIAPALCEDAGEYYQVVSSFGGMTTSGDPIALVSTCGADVGAAGGVPGFDCVHDVNDFIVFINYFFQGDRRADRGRQGGLAGQDGQLNNDDFVVFVNQFFAGCG